MVAASVDHITGEIVDTAWYTDMLSAQDALDIFIDQYKEVLQNVYVDQIILGYAEDYSKLDYTKWQTSYVPYWKIIYRLEAVSSTAINQLFIPKSMMINAIDGSIF